MVIKTVWIEFSDKSFKELGELLASYTGGGSRWVLARSRRDLLQKCYLKLHHNERRNKLEAINGRVGDEPDDGNFIIKEEEWYE